MKKFLIKSLFVFALTLLVFSCDNSKIEDKSMSSDKHEGTHVKKQDCNDVHWSHHEGEEGPAHWKDLCDAFAACGGQAQSPINIVTNETSVGTNLNQIQIHYDSTPVDIINNGHTVQFNVSGNNTITLGEKEYKLLQFHYHAASEHTINGNHYPIEVHFVNQYSDSDYSVVGAMFEEGTANELFTEYLAEFPESKGEYTSENTIDLEKLLPSNLDYYYYIGSLTTPPCSEIVNWYVLKTPIKASKEQIEKFAGILHHNYRPVMPLNDRKVLSYNK
ncbi:MAG: carbonic anhydrase family protein [Bacteroidetes bacterium]|nr:carbonic anhydrase family protein [Bacteroidota bacterium]MBU1116086.1 carbonic anhydrase family protein [Bacteroidota bacterium]MBU1799490.1 carbonic anhydrase family protein [Bacteroidota bacterium]